MKDKVNYISPETWTKIYQTIPELKIRKWRDHDVIMLFKTLYWVGLRPTEAIIREKKDFDLENREIYLGKTKTKNADYAPIPKLFMQELNDWLNTMPEGRLWPNLNYNTFYKWLVRLGKMLEIQAWTVPQSQSHEKTKGHIGRKSVGKDMFMGTYGVVLGPEIISKQLRHAKPSITMDHYLKATIDSVKEVW